MHLIQRHDHSFEHALFFSEVLGLFCVIPDFGIFQQAVHFLQALLLVFVVKDTPEVRGGVG